MPEFGERCLPDPRSCSCPGHGPGGWNVAHVAPCCEKPHTPSPEEEAREKAMRLELAGLEQRLKRMEKEQEMEVSHYNPQTGRWEPSEPIPVQDIVAKVEFWLRDRGFKRIPNLLGWWDERGLG